MTIDMAALGAAVDAELLTQAEELGRQAYADGRPNAPGIDPAIRAMIDGWEVGTGAAGVLRAFTRGYDGAVEAAMASSTGPGIEVGAMVLSWDLDEPVEYGGPDPAGASLIYVVGRGKGGMTVLCKPEMVAPAGIPLAHPSDPRIDVYKGRRPWTHLPGDWGSGLPGRAATWHKTKREATAAAVRRLAILDWHDLQRANT